MQHDDNPTEESKNNNSDNGEPTIADLWKLLTEQSAKRDTFNNRQDAINNELKAAIFRLESGSNSGIDS